MSFTIPSNDDMFISKDLESNMYESDNSYVIMDGINSENLTIPRSLPAVCASFYALVHSMLLSFMNSAAYTIDLYCQYTPGGMSIAIARIISHTFLFLAEKLAPMMLFDSTCLILYRILDPIELVFYYSWGIVILNVLSIGHLYPLLAQWSIGGMDMCTLALLTTYFSAYLSSFSHVYRMVFGLRSPFLQYQIVPGLNYSRLSFFHATGDAACIIASVYICTLLTSWKLVFAIMCITATHTVAFVTHMRYYFRNFASNTESDLETVIDYMESDSRFSIASISIVRQTAQSFGNDTEFNGLD